MMKKWIVNIWAVLTTASIVYIWAAFILSPEYPPRVVGALPIMVNAFFFTTYLVVILNRDN